MKNNKQKAAAYLLSPGLLLSMSACSAPLPETDATTATATTTTAEAVAATTEKTEETTTMTEAAEPFVLNEPITDAMYSRAVLNSGSRARLAAVFNRAKRGEEITIGYIGGSITQGSSAKSSDNSYVMRNFEWWVENVTENIDMRNAGIGATDSYVGVHRVDKDLLAYSPDVVIVEFSVNDTRPLVNKNSYDSLVRKILSSPDRPAVILLITTMEDGTSLQDIHKEIGLAYDLPIISYHDAILPETASSAIKWSDISPDNIHPNDEGHRIVAELLNRYLEDAFAEADDFSGEPADFTAEPLTKDIYADARIANSESIAPTENEDFYDSDKMPQFKGGWTSDVGGRLVFEVEARSFGIMFYRTTDGKSGKYDVLVDGERKSTVDGDFTGGWGNFADTKQVFSGGEAAPHTIEIRPAEGSEDKGITILGLMIS